MPQSQTAALPRHQEEEETDKTKTSTNRSNVRKALRLAQIEQTYQKELRLALSPQAR